LADQRKERFEVLRVETRRKRGVHPSQQSQEEVDQQRRYMQLKYLNGRTSYYRIAFQYEPDNQ